MLPVHLSKNFIYLPLLTIVTFTYHQRNNNQMDSDDAICINTNFIKFSDSVGAVALPDGRVLICGGEMLEKKDDWVGKMFLFW